MWPGVIYYRHGTHFHPVTLYSPSLGQLMTDVWRGLEVLPADVVRLAVSFVTELNGVFEREAGRQAIVLKMLKDLLPSGEYTVEPICVGATGHTTDGTVMVGGSKLCNVEVKNETSSSGDPMLQNVGHVAGLTLGSDDHRRAGVAPMIGMTVAGNYLSFSGAVLVGGHLVVEPLTDLIWTRCTTDSFEMVARMLVALRSAILGVRAVSSSAQPCMPVLAADIAAGEVLLE